jgi:hypothetical protein
MNIAIRPRYVSALLLTLTVFALPPCAQASQWHNGGEQHYHGGSNYHGGGGYHGGNNNGAVIGGVLLGLGLGAVVGGALAQPGYAPPPPVYYAPPPPGAYYAPPPIAYSPY